MAITTATRQIDPIDFERFRGDTIEIPFQLALGSAVLKISDCSDITFSLRKKYSDTVALVTKTKGAGINTYDDLLGKGVVRLEVGDSPPATITQTYYYDIQVTEVANNNRVTTVMWGRLTLTVDVTK